MQGIVFNGPSLHVASVILGQKVKNEKAVERELKRLKDSNVQSGQTIAFMFSCCGRGHYFYKKNNVESTVFRRLFPGIPLLGFFGNGEIGHEHLPQLRTADCNIDDDLPEIIHSYSTIFVLLSWQN